MHGYFVNRGRDSKDIITATMGLGAGTKIRIGPIYFPPLIINHDIVGLRGSKFFLNTHDLIYPEDGERGLPFSLPGQGFWFVDVFIDDADAARDKHIENIGIYFFSLGCAPYEYSELEVAAGFGPSFRLGTNPGELLDFFLGWATIDIYNDDIGFVEEKDFSIVGKYVFTDDSLMPNETFAIREILDELYIYLNDVQFLLIPCGKESFRFTTDTPNIKQEWYTIDYDIKRKQFYIKSPDNAEYRNYFKRKRGFL